MAARLSRRPGRRVLLVLAALAAVALALRLVALGERVMYYDEAWFGYWVLRFVDTGAWAYRPTLHGPFFARVNPSVFGLLGPSEFSGRLVVAGIGGLLPLVAWLFRERLRDAEVVALGALLALNPILLYYSRFMRKDLPLAAFMLLTLGLVVRFADTRRPRYLYGAALSLGLAFGTKESVLLWLLTWLGAGVLLVDRRLLVARTASPDGARAAARDLLDRAAAGVRRWGHHVAGATLCFLVVVLYFYAPRAPAGGGPGLWNALGGQFGQLPAVVSGGTVDAAAALWDHWVTGYKQDHPYLPYLQDTLRTLAAGAPAVCVLAVVGFLHDRYVGDGPRDLVALGFYGGAASALGYPLANHFPVPWSTVHAVAPLAIPAAVGAVVALGWVHNGARDLLDGPAGVPALRGGLVGVAVVALVVSSALTGATATYLEPHESPKHLPGETADGGSELVYYAQPPASLRRGTDAIAAAAASGGDDLDVLYVGDALAGDESAMDRPPETGAWYARMPLPWYTEATGADVESVRQASEIRGRPPVVVATPDAASQVAEELPTYRSFDQPLDDAGDRSVVFFVPR